MDGWMTRRYGSYYEQRHASTTGQLSMYMATDDYVAVGRTVTIHLGSLIRLAVSWTIQQQQRGFSVPVPVMTIQSGAREGLSHLETPISCQVVAGGPQRWWNRLHKKQAKNAERASLRNRISRRKGKERQLPAAKAAPPRTRRWVRLPELRGYASCRATATLETYESSRCRSREAIRCSLRIG